MSVMDKTYIIAGASSGIGLALAQKMLENGHRVYALSRSAGELANHPKYSHIAFDFSSQGILPEIAEKADALVYCPGSITLKPLARLTAADIDNDFMINARSAFLFIQKYLANIKDSQDASILLFSSVAAQTGLPFHSSIAMAKGAVEGLTRSLAAELSPGIRVNAIAPSLTDTPLAAALLNSEARMEGNIQRHPLKAIGAPNEIASFAYHLLQESKWATGQVFGINGGLGTIIK